MRTFHTLAFLSIVLLAAPSPAFADGKKETAQTQASATNTQTSVRHLRLKLRARQAAAVNQ
jgi:hypothetical protein